MMAENESTDSDRKLDNGLQERRSPVASRPAVENGVADRIKKEVTSEQDAPLDFSIKRPKGEDNGPVKSPSASVNSHGGSGDSVSDSGDSKSDEEHDMRIGEPQTALPGMLPGTNFPFMAAGMHGLQPGMLGAAFMNQQSEKQSKQGSKKTRPFKAYPKDPLSLPIGSFYGIPGMTPIQGAEHVNAQNVGSEELFNQYRQYLIRAQEQLQRKAATTNKKHPNSCPISPTAVPLSPTQVPMSNNHQQRRISSPALDSDNSSPSSTPSHLLRDSPATCAESGVPTSTHFGIYSAATTTSPVSSSMSRKRPRCLPDEQKDEAYWERRRKNNEAAKRSRDARRAKEDEIAIRAAFLEQENLKLRVEVAALKNETAKLRCLLYNS